MASGHEKCRINRPDTWQLRPSSAKQIKSLDNTEPSTHGTKLSSWARFEVVRSTPDFRHDGPEGLHDRLELYDLQELRIDLHLSAAGDTIDFTMKG